MATILLVTSATDSWESSLEGGAGHGHGHIASPELWMSRWFWIWFCTVQYSTVLAAISYINIILNLNEGNKGCGCGKADICID